MGISPCWYCSPFSTRSPNGFPWNNLNYLSVCYTGFFRKAAVACSGRLWWILLWALLFTVIEFIAYVNHSITHHYGWSLLCSFLFNVVTFSLLIIHQKTALAAWILSGSFIAFLFIFFDIPMP